MNRMTSKPRIPIDPTRPLRREGIKNSIDRVKEIMDAIPSVDLGPTNLSEQAKLRIERSKPGSEKRNS